MTRKLLFLPGLILIVSLSTRAQDKGEIFGGYSYERYNASPGRNLNGLEISGQYKFANWLGGVADLDAHFGLPSQPDNRILTFMAGPQISFPARLSPFFHLLVGVGHIRAGIADTSFSTAIGGGLDMRIAPAFAWRIVQADDEITRFFGTTQHSPRISTGIVFRF